MTVATVVKISNLKPSKFSESIYSSEPDQGLIDSIRINGVLDPIWITDDKIIISGHRRVNACKALEIEDIDAEIRDYSDLLVIESNRYRQKTTRELLAEGKALRKIENKKAKLRQGSRTDICENFRESEKGRSSDKVGEKIGISGRQLEKLEVIEKKKPELLDKIDKDEESVHSAYQKIIKEEKKAENKAALEDLETKKAKEIEGVFDVIVIDPPWQIKKIERDCRPNQSEFDYPTMSIEQLAEIKVPYADKCHVWLWTTHKYLPTAFELLKKWNLKYICTFVWHKPGGFQPVGLPQYNGEFALYARKGSPEFIDTKALPVCFEAPRGKHSEKPEEFYDVLRRVTGGRRLDMFNRRPIEGFETWGNET